MYICNMFVYIVYGRETDVEQWMEENMCIEKQNEMEAISEAAHWMEKLKKMVKRKMVNLKLYIISPSTLCMVLKCQWYLN